MPPGGQMLPLCAEPPPWCELPGWPMPSCAAAEQRRLKLPPGLCERECGREPGRLLERLSLRAAAAAAHALPPCTEPPCTELPELELVAAPAEEGPAAGAVRWWTCSST